MMSGNQKTGVIVLGMILLYFLVNDVLNHLA